jgi:hypothetical protein
MINKSMDPIGILKGPAIKQSYQNSTPDEEDTVAAFMYKRDLCKEARGARERNWEYNRLQIKGEQLIVRDRNNSGVLRVVVEDESKQKYSVDNILRPTVRASVGKHVRIIPGVAIVPGGTDREDFLAAELLEAYKDYVWRTEKLRLKYKRAHDNIPAFGTSILQLAWDFMKGRKLAWCGSCEFTSEFFADGEECPYCAGVAQMDHAMMQQEAMMQELDPSVIPAPPVPTLQKIFEGGISVLLHDVRDFQIDPGATELDIAQWCYVERALPVSVIRHRFPEAAEKVVVEDGLYNDRFINYSGSWTNSRVETQYLRDYARLYEYHEMPSAEWPEGRILYICNSRILYEGPNPYVDVLGRLPFYAIRGDRNPGEFYGEDWVGQAVQPQKERNKLATQMRTSRELTLNPQTIIEANSGVSMEQMDTVAGKIIRVNRGSRSPSPLQVAQLPPYVQVELDRMAQSIKQKAGVTDQELGLSPGAPSGRYAAILDAQSSETIAPIVIENSEEWLEMNRGILQLAQRYESPTKKFQVPGHSRVRSYHWSNVNLGWDIELADEDVLSKNPALRMQQGLELLQAGVFTNQETGMPDMKSFMRYTRLKMPVAGADLDNVEHAYAAQIPDMMARGVPVMPAPWDDANIIAEELLGWLRGPGRNADKELVANVAQMWMMYAQAMRPTMAAQGLLPNGGLARTAPVSNGGSPYQGQGPGRPQPSDAQGIINKADADSEAMANSRSHES